MTEMVRATFRAWDDDDLQEQFCGFIAAGMMEHEAIDEINRINEMNGTGLRVSYSQYVNHLRRHHQFGRMVTAAMAAAGSAVEKQLRQHLLSEGTAVEQQRYLNLLESRIKRREGMITRQEEHDMAIALELNDRVQSPAELAEKRAQQHVVDIDIIEGELEEAVS